jgi:hypothetical protein
MKTDLMTTILTGALVLGATQWLLADEREKAGTITRSVTAEDVQGSDLWDFHGNKIGGIERVLLTPSSTEAFVVVDASAFVDGDRHVVVPWSKLFVKVKAGTEDEAVYTLDTTKAQLKTAPVYNVGAGSHFGTAERKTVCEFWGVAKNEPIRGALDPVRRPE